jgi:hypothetical protein
VPLVLADTDPTWVEVLNVLPGVLWPILAFVAVAVFFGPLRRRVVDLRSVKAGSFEATFADALRRDEPAGTNATDRDRRGAAGRALRTRDACVDRKVLWVDDEPGGNQALARTIRDLLGIQFLFALSTSEALCTLAHDEQIVMIITNMARGGDDRAGLDLIRASRDAQLSRWTVMYVRRLDPDLGTPAGAFAITNRPDELVHYIIDICEREYAP